MAALTGSLLRKFLALSIPAALVLMAAVTASLLLLDRYGNDIPYRTVESRTISGIDFDSRSSDPKLSSIKEFSGSRSANLKEVAISFDAMVYSIPGWSNLFQTGPADSGIRLELGRPSDLALGVGARNAGGARFQLLTRSLSLNQWHSFRIVANRQNHVKVFLDNAPAADFTDNDLRYAVSDIAIGTGFDKSRPLDGAIRNFSMTYRIISKNDFLAAALFCLRAFLAIWLVPLSMLLVLRAIGWTESPPAVAGARLVYGILLAGSLWACAYFLYNSWCGLSYPFTSPLFVPQDRFMDFFNLNFRAAVDYRYTQLHAIAPPFGFLVARGFSLFADYSAGPFAARTQAAGLGSMGLFAAVFSGGLLLLARRMRSLFETGNSTRSRVDTVLFAAALLTCYPVLYAIDRGNYIMMAFVFLYFFIYSRNQNSWLAGLALAAAISQKAHLLVYLIALSDKAHRKALILTLFWLVVLNALANVALNDFTFIPSFFQDYIAFSKLEMGAAKFFNSPSLISVVYSLFCDLLSHERMHSIEQVYSPLAVLALFWTSFVVRKRVADVNMRLFYITVLLIVLPVASFDYNLILLLLFIPYLVHRGFPILDTILLTLALIPKHYITLHLQPYGPTYLRFTEQTILTPLLLTAVLLLGRVRFSTASRLLSPADRRGWVCGLFTTKAGRPGRQDKNYSQRRYAC